MGGKDKGKSSEEVDPPHLATYSLFRLRKLLRVGGRHLLPLPDEIAAVEVCFLSLRKGLSCKGIVVSTCVCKFIYHFITSTVFVCVCSVFVEDEKP